jgi:hypothetical protein
LNLREKIQERLDELQRMMETQSHLDNPELVTEKLESIAKFWSICDESEREFISAVRVAIKDQVGWEV